MKRVLGVSSCVYSPKPLVVSLILLCAVWAPFRARAEQFEDFIYEVTSSNTVAITGYTGASGNVVIPSMIANNSVTSIRNYAFYYGSGLTSIAVPDSVTSIGDGAFSSCSALTSVSFLGNSPTAGDFLFNDSPMQTVYYRVGTTGWGATYEGISTVHCTATTPEMVPHEWLLTNYPTLVTDEDYELAALDDQDADAAPTWSEYLAGSDPNNSASFPVLISGTVQYSGSQTGVVHVAATNSIITRSAQLLIPGEYSITNVPSLTIYWVTAFHDSNANRTHDTWEAEGRYPVNPIYEIGDVTGIDIDLTDPDRDNDGLFDYQEIFIHNTYPLMSDSDGDGLSDGAEVNTHNTDPLNSDSDGDQLWDGAEVNTYGTDPLDADSDDDGLSDEVEVNTHGTDPNDSDSDDDGLSDGVEIDIYGTDPNDSDSDDDGLSDRAEIDTHSSNPLDSDSDDDGLSDGAEINTHNTHPLDTDSDDDGFDDGLEVSVGSDPNNAASFHSLIVGVANYPGIQTGMIYVAVTNSMVTHSEQLLSPGEYSITNVLTLTNYWFTAFRDANGNEMQDTWEAAGSYSNPVYVVDYVTEIDIDLTDPDTDSDGLFDYQELFTHNTDPLDSDSDDDGLTDGEEVNTHGTDPNDADSDDDSLNDEAEVNTHGTDPNDADSDDDGLTDGEEVDTHNTDPLDVDSDHDDLWDGAEVHAYGTDPNDDDSDDDGLTDAMELNVYNTDPLDSDSDDDGLSDEAEVNTHGTDPNSADSDNDGLSDEEEVNTHSTDPNDTDSDDDGLSDEAEVNTHGTDPNDADADDDGLSDGEEVNTHSTDPLDSDSDDDDLSDEAEVNTHSTDPLDYDSDDDLLADGEEVNTYGTDPNSADSDGDGLSDEEELNTYGTDPLDSDSDDDGFDDGLEVSAGSDPNNAASFPASFTVSIGGTVDYSGIQTGMIYVAATSSIVTRSAQLLIPGEYSITNVPAPTNYWVNAFRDSNGNEMQDTWEAVGSYSNNPVYLTNDVLGIDIDLTDPDTDSDGLFDYQELLTHNTDPLDSDSDDDGLSDGAEAGTYGTDPNDADSDDDGLSDEAEVNTHGTDPNSADSDDDDLSDSEELDTYGTDPNDADSDDDGSDDGHEIAAGTDPLNVTDVFMIMSVANTTNAEMCVEWNAKSGMIYGVDVSADLPGNWTNAPNGVGPEHQNEQVALSNGVMRYYDTQAAGSTSRFYRVYTWIDAYPPVITLLGENPYAQQVDVAWSDPGWTAIDNYDGDISSNVVVSGTVDVSSVGTHLLYYNVSDSSGNPAVQKTRIVEVVDPNAPSGMVLVEAGTAAGGSVTNSDAFYIDVYEVTKANWDVVAGWAETNGYDITTGGGGGSGNHPVVYVTWYECVKWCNARSEKEGKTACYTVGGSVYRQGESVPDCDFSAHGYRLPREAEWEYAARGGKNGNDTEYSGSDTIGDVAWYLDNGGGDSHEVGTKAVNELGTFDMSGNAWEWCWDVYPGLGRVRRGGGWGSSTYYCRVTGRRYGGSGTAYNGVGFRTCLPPAP